MAALAIPGLAILLSGCSTFKSINPVNWWHSAEGGKIAEQRPPPPGADQAYPNLATVPGRPAPPDKDAMRKLTDSLVADRANAQHSAEAAPLADPSSPAASPALFGTGTLPPPPPPRPGGASASLPAASAPSAPPAPRPGSEVATPPSRAPVAPVQSAPLASPVSAATPPPAPAAMPPLPDAPPPRPAVAGTPAAPPAVATPAPMPVAGESVAVDFAAGSAAMTPTGTDAVKRLASRRGAAIVAVTGHGDAASSDPAAQTVAVSLGLSRAQAVANALAAAGVPRDAIRVAAEAGGRGASLRLLQ